MTDITEEDRERAREISPCNCAAGADARLGAHSALCASLNQADIAAALAQARDEGMVEGKELGLWEAVSDVCDYCGGRSRPDDPRWHVAHGPNASGNYYHQGPMPERRVLCKASAIRHVLRALANERSKP